MIVLHDRVKSTTTSLYEFLTLHVAIAFCDFPRTSTTISRSSQCDISTPTHRQHWKVCRKVTGRWSRFRRYQVPKDFHSSELYGTSSSQMDSDSIRYLRLVLPNVFEVIVVSERFWRSFSWIYFEQRWSAAKLISHCDSQTKNLLFSASCRPNTLSLGTLQLAT